MSRPATLFLLLPLALLLLALAPRLRADELALTVSHIPEGGGHLMIQVLGSETALQGGEPATASFMLPATGSEVALTTTALPPGTYAVRVLHDRNGNQEMDSNVVGMPTEPWGFSNNATGSFGPPGWEAVLFELRGSTRQDIRLVQP